MKWHKLLYFTAEGLVEKEYEVDLYYGVPSIHYIQVGSQKDNVGSQGMVRNK